MEEAATSDAAGLPRRVPGRRGGRSRSGLHRGRRDHDGRPWCGGRREAAVDDTARFGADWTMYLSLGIKPCSCTFNSGFKVANELTRLGSGDKGCKFMLNV